MADLTASSGAPTLTFDDTSGSGVDWRIQVDPDDEMHIQRWSSGLSSWLNRLVITASDTTVYGALLVQGSEPALTFVDYTTGDDDFRLRVTGDILYIESDSGGGFGGRMTISASDIVFNVSPTIYGSGPSLVFSDSGGYDFRVRAGSDVLHFEANTGGGFGAGLEMDADGYVYALRGLSSGHDALTTPSHAICWKRAHGTLDSGEVAAGYFTRSLTDLTPPEWNAKTLGVIVMMSDGAGGASSTFQVSDWRSSSASGYFSVQVIYGDGSSTGDQVKVTFDPGTMVLVTRGVFSPSTRPESTETHPCSTFSSSSPQPSPPPGPSIPQAVISPPFRMASMGRLKVTSW